MGFFKTVLSKLNPINWVKSFFTGKVVGGQIRTWLAALGGFLINQDAVSDPQIAIGFVDSLIALLLDPQFQGWVLMLLSGVASVFQKIWEKKVEIPKIVAAEVEIATSSGV